MPTPTLPDLPIVTALPALMEAMAAHTRTILEAPPGAGKSTIVPIHLLTAGWASGERILMLEPRRVAARAVAARMAQLLGEPLGQTVGYRTRLERNVGPATRLEVITEGILTRMLQDDPALEGTVCVIFDEYHERSLQADLGLALCLDAQRHLRSTLRLLVMSATLDGQRLAAMLGDAAMVRAEGRRYDVTTNYVSAPATARTPLDDIERRVTSIATAALERHDGDTLVFLPGAGEIRRTAALLAEVLPGNVLTVPLYGDLSAEAQDQALKPAPPGRRKLVLATNIAETSLTIEGVRVVIDCGFERRPSFDPNTGMSRLETVRISRASADQRRGRAGRTAAGVCYRLWSESVDESLAAHAPPEIVEADLAPLALELAAWGVTDASTLNWLDPPPRATLAQARDLLVSLEALDVVGRITAAGRRMLGLGVHPRLAHMIVRAEALGHVPLATRLAALLSERDVLRGTLQSRDPDVRVRAELLEHDRAQGRHDVDSQALRLVRRSEEQISRRWRASTREDANAATRLSADSAAGLLLAYAYPDRIGQARGTASGQYLLSGGRGAHFAAATALARQEFIVAATLDGGERDARIQLAAPLERSLIDRYLGDTMNVSEIVTWDTRSASVLAQRERRLGALLVDSSSLSPLPAEAVQREMLHGIRNLGFASLPWTLELEQWRARVLLLRDLDEAARESWPDVSDTALLDRLDAWLAPWLGGASRREHLARVDLRAALHSMLDWPQQQRLEQLAPTRIEVPSGSRIAVDYASGRPSMSVRLQEVFGLFASPRIAGGRVPVTLQLLSPAQRPVQITNDLASFWQRGYAEVRRELKGRYPRHYWPDDPLVATPTRRVRPR